MSSTQRSNMRQPQGRWARIWPGLCLIPTALLVGCISRPLSPSQSTSSEATPANPPTSIAFVFPSDPPAPTQEPTVTPVPTLELASWRYTHPDALFQLSPPAGWATNNNDHAVWLTDPNGHGSIHFQVVNTGYPLNAESVTRFINARELNVFGGSEHYQEIDRRSDRGVEIITKELAANSPMVIVETHYRQVDDAIWIIDLWMSRDVFAAYSQALAESLASARLNQEIATNLGAYTTGDVFDYANEFIALELPPSWRHQQAVGDNSVVDTFYSPDERALVQVIVFDDGKSMSRTVAGAFSLAILREYYTRDITVTTDRILKDGRELLIWRDLRGDYQGMTTFEVRGTTIIFITVMYDQQFQDYYQDLLDALLNSYSIRPAVQP